MAKKQKNTEVESIPQVVEQPKVETPVMEIPEPKTRKRLKPSNEWEIKDRMYLLKGGKKPLSRSIKAADIFYFDEEKGYERELKYTNNQKTPFVDEFPKESQARLEHIIFRNGHLSVPRNKQTLQKLLSLYHPHSGKVFLEHNPIKNAENEIDLLEFEIAGDNKNYVPAEAMVVGNKVHIFSSSIPKPIYARYAWKDSSTASLFNKEGLPASSFTTE